MSPEGRQNPAKTPIRPGRMIARNGLTMLNLPESPFYLEFMINSGFDLVRLAMFAYILLLFGGGA